MSLPFSFPAEIRFQCLEQEANQVEVYMTPLLGQTGYEDEESLDKDGVRMNEKKEHRIWNEYPGQNTGNSIGLKKWRYESPSFRMTKWWKSFCNNTEWDTRISMKSFFWKIWWLRKWRSRIRLKPSAPYKLTRIDSRISSPSVHWGGGEEGGRGKDREGSKQVACWWKKSLIFAPK